MAAREFGMIDVDRIFLYEENPRHEPIHSEPEIIELLCRDEQVYNLARSISEEGTNPLELLGLVEAAKSGAKKNYIAWEGNRRVCAIKLLNDPDRAPPHLRKDFARLSSESTHVPIKKLNCVVFENHDDLKFWMAITHDGVQGGVGRRPWDTAQKARHFGTSSRNKLALAILDIAEAMGLISKTERDGKLTTAQRFLSNNLVREAIGFDQTAPDDITYNRPLADFRKQLARFITDLKDGVRISSRMNRPQIDAYGRTLARSKDISGERTAPQSLRNAAGGKPSPAKSKRTTKPKQPRKRTRLDYNRELSSALESIRSRKLESLYYSICSINLDHTPLLTIGVWAFVESLSALAGKSESVDFVAFYSKQRLAELGFKEKAIRDALERIQRNGNSTKHHEIAATFDGAQLSNDLETVTPLLIKMVENLASKK